ncbi:MAG: arginine--tRNA ligase [Ignavibacteriaceae bacterium]|nr:arginine--tRNA ligase [Ignavibacteriaceae bacterium]
MKKYLQKIFKEGSKQLAYLGEVELTFDTPKIETHGDLSSNAAMILSKKLKRNPREIATEILSILNIDESIISKTEIAGPGFINFYFTPAFVAGIVNDIIAGGDSFGKSKKYFGKRANVEFVSANPTGPLTVGHGRNAVIGDTIANMLEWIGYSVDREYYFNNAGRQMRVLGDSVKIRYLNLLGKKIDFPEDYYQGEYINDIAGKIKDEFGNQLINEPAEGKFKEIAEAEIFDDIKKTLTRLSISHGLFFNEKSLYDDGKITDLLSKFDKAGLSYKKDGAIWLKLSELGSGEDKVIVKATGEPTYRLPDIAYHETKFERDYDLIVDLFGSDHVDTYPDVLAGLRALGYDDSKIKVLIHQFVTFLKDGGVVKMSTRKDDFTPLDELIDEVGSDVVRYFFNMRTISSHMNFDIDLAKKQSDENPVFYLQYAHARICSIIRTVVSEDLEAVTENLDLLTSEEEQSLLKKLSGFEEEILYSAENIEPQKICAYLEELAAAFHKFYTFRRILGSEKNIAEARLALAVATKTVIKNGLTILGVSAPEKM